MDKQEYLNQYEERLSKALCEMCSTFGLLDGQLLQVEELDEKWKEMAPNYMADAVPIVKDYPIVSIVWACYLGMGLASLWDSNWSKIKDHPNLYNLFVAPRSFDNMDEYILDEIIKIPFSSHEGQALAKSLKTCAEFSETMIRKERIEPSTPEAFYVFAKTTEVLFKIGVSVELKRLGYSYQKLTLELPTDPKLNS